MDGMKNFNELSRCYAIHGVPSNDEKTVRFSLDGS